MNISMLFSACGSNYLFFSISLSPYVCFMKGLAYVDFSDDKHLAAAISKNKQMLLGKKLSIARSDPNQRKQDGHNVSKQHGKLSGVQYPLSLSLMCMCRWAWMYNFLITTCNFFLVSIIIKVWTTWINSTDGKLSISELSIKLLFEGWNCISESMWKFQSYELAEYNNFNKNYAVHEVASVKYFNIAWPSSYMFCQS